MKARHNAHPREETEGVRGRLPTIICPFCDQRIRSSESLIRCRNCGEAFERELAEEEHADFF